MKTTGSRAAPICFALLSAAAGLRCSNHVGTESPDCVDDDRDGFGRGSACRVRDCDDGDPATYPGAMERCDGRDNNCDGRIDEGVVCSLQDAGPPALDAAPDATEDVRISVLDPPDGATSERSGGGDTTLDCATEDACRPERDTAATTDAIADVPGTDTIADVPGIDVARDSVCSDAATCALDVPVDIERCTAGEECIIPRPPDSRSCPRLGRTACGPARCASSEPETCQIELAAIESHIDRPYPDCTSASPILRMRTSGSAMGVRCIIAPMDPIGRGRAILDFYCLNVSLETHESRHNLNVCGRCWEGTIRYIVCCTCGMDPLFDNLSAREACRDGTLRSERYLFRNDVRLPCSP